MYKFTLISIVALMLLLHHPCLAQDDNFLSFPTGQVNNNIQGNSNEQRQRQNQPPNVPLPNLPIDDTTTTTASPVFRSCVENCRTIQNYNPVCGSDGVTYNNQFRLQCARRCGLNVEMVRGGTCVSL
ncbi:uncharacterized protein LOC126737337 [Anthonomus grandis grandis]|uniref:uncharacterized protein LOC126737337 n=1 Tax=Anthonomus grandis grandis TaxID=2921223 RepID=UPI002166AA4B|nr:uncharacterized protein LOC126737337 [Anthonomus grandis grandis]